jgi:hypothetical protein
MHRNWKRIIIWSYLVLWLAAFVFLLVRALSTPLTLWMFAIFPVAFWGVLLPWALFVCIRRALSEFPPHDADHGPTA